MFLLIVFALIVKCYCQYPYINENSLNLSLVYKWNYLKYDLNDPVYVAENNFYRDLKIHNGIVYVSIPRWKQGVPVTLAMFRLEETPFPTSPVLEPFPKSMQQLGDCDALQSAHTIDIDAEEKLWILDSGMVEELDTTNRTVCPPKLVIIDLHTTIVDRRSVIPVHMVRPSSVFTSMTIGSNVAYIVDSSEYASAIIVYNYTTSVFQRFSCEQLTPEDEKPPIVDFPSKLMAEFVSISLNTDHSKLYFSPFDSDELYLVNVTAFKSNVADISSMVDKLGKNGRNTKLIADDRGYMYFDIVNHKAVAQWREGGWSFQYTPSIVVQNKMLRNWISSLDLDEHGYLWIMTGRFYDFINDKMDLEKDNFRIFKMYVERQAKPKKMKPGIKSEYIVLILFVIIIGLIIIEILMFNTD